MTTRVTLLGGVGSREARVRWQACDVDQPASDAANAARCIATSSPTWRGWWFADSITATGGDGLDGQATGNDDGAKIDGGDLLAFPVDTCNVNAPNEGTVVRYENGTGW